MGKISKISISDPPVLLGQFQHCLEVIFLVIFQKIIDITTSKVAMSAFLWLKIR